MIDWILLHVPGPHEKEKPKMNKAQKTITPTPMLFPPSSIEDKMALAIKAMHMMIAPENKIMTRPIRSMAKIVMKVEKKLTIFKTRAPIILPRLPKNPCKMVGA